MNQEAAGGYQSVFVKALHLEEISIMSMEALVSRWEHNSRQHAVILRNIKRGSTRR
ncbi:hypothetical protein [Paenibacillus donghaensis]|uniref:hypothetical protein n=1 Tax=Paenibacillus donghaensis TaxID=414771 RepID=UPI0012FCFAD4|nr:hypothetical protein [Paenibacillus donghaensis]